jgi:hypothetical protein
MAAAAWTIHYGMTGLLPGRRVVAQIVRLGAAIGGALAVLAATARLLGIDQFNDIVTWAEGRLTRGRGHESC